MKKQKLEFEEDFSQSTGEKLLSLPHIPVLGPICMLLVVSAFLCQGKLLFVLVWATIELPFAFVLLWYSSQVISQFRKPFFKDDLLPYVLFTPPVYLYLCVLIHKPFLQDPFALMLPTLFASAILIFILTFLFMKRLTLGIFFIIVLEASVLSWGWVYYYNQSGRQIPMSVETFIVSEVGPKGKYSHIRVRSKVNGRSYDIPNTYLPQTSLGTQRGYEVMPGKLGGIWYRLHVD